MRVCAACGVCFDNRKGGGGLCPGCWDSVCGAFGTEVAALAGGLVVGPGAVPVLLASYRQARQVVDRLRSVLDGVGLVFPELGAGVDAGGRPVVHLGAVPLSTARRLARLLPGDPPGTDTRRAA